jgi:hypothetical protein
MDEEQRLVSLWQNQPLSENEMSMQMVMDRATKFQRKIRFRNLTEYVAGGVVMVWAALSVVQSQAPVLIKVGSALLGLGALFVVTFLRLRGHAAYAEPPLAQPTRELVSWHRAELVRQRDLLRSVPRWYLAPFLPGMILILVGGWLKEPEKAWRVGLTAAMVAAVFAGVAWLNRRGARKLDERARELEGGSEG